MHLDNISQGLMSPCWDLRLVYMMKAYEEFYLTYYSTLWAFERDWTEERMPENTTQFFWLDHYAYFGVKHQRDG